MKKVIKNVEYVAIKDVEQGSSDLAVTINGIDLIEMELEKGVEILSQHNLIKDGHFIIPAGYSLVGITQHGGAFEYEFQNGDTNILVDMSFDNEEEEAQYIA
ncbi:hypothetical protein D3C81_587410 [compost metagenome]